MPFRPRVRRGRGKQEEVCEGPARREAAGYEVDGEVPGTSIGVPALRENPPDAFVIDLGRLPSHGREVAFSLRHSKALRGIPIVFVGGAEAKLGAIREQLPDAVYTAWDGIAADLAAAIENPPVDPVVPESDSGPRSGKPLAQKLGIKEEATIALLDPPDGIEATLAPLPPAVTLRP